ncbi:chromatin remodeling complex subunit (Chd3) [Purpureocillium lavendulum]|uniref:Chromatin remodeling complex subunit (Chd3) n=1 Tax=Purpureocillium lavendulum TaxID=1247861 RepID=A0AB34FWL2_9HYPO|nr:chromatin remodeling complex subunit (Chd3) [Purpureocillium lavendulum]
MHDPMVSTYTTDGQGSTCHGEPDVRELRAHGGDAVAGADALQMDDDNTVDEAVARLLHVIQESEPSNEHVGVPSPGPGLPMPEISFDFVTSDVGQYGLEWRDSSPDAPAALLSETHGEGAVEDAVPDAEPRERVESLPAPTQQSPGETSRHSETPPQLLAEKSPDLSPQNPIPARFEIAIPEMPFEMRADYSEVHSTAVERIVEAVPGRGKVQYRIEMTNGREELISSEDLVFFENGSEALRIFNNQDMSSRKRKHGPEDDWRSEAEYPESDGDVMEIDLDEEDLPRHRTSRAGRTLRSQIPNSSRISTRTSHSSDEDSDGVVNAASTRRTRTLRQRQPQPANLYTASTKIVADLENDELANDPQQPSDQDDDDFRPVVSDLSFNKKSRRVGALQRAHRMGLHRRLGQKSRTATRNGSDGSDIEFEQPRRSSRATRNMLDMRDDAFMDDESFYVIDDKSPAAPRVLSIREVFQTLPADSSFAMVHMGTCHTCGGSKQRGQIVHCQGCSLSYHKHCLGIRSAREHLVTKIEEDSFVLQCRYCINITRKKDKGAPKHSMCQTCRADGEACAPFSQKKTTRQEEKLREENGGTDPITAVSPKLVNNQDILLFRCVTCHRGWHLDHLPRAGSEPIGTDVKSERLKDYMVDWQCNECSTTKHKIHRLVAWRPSNQLVREDSAPPSFEDLNDDGKEYLVKWETRSYFHCTWMSGAWIFGTSVAAMRSAFSKKDAEHSLLKMTEKEAIPDEYLMADIIFNVKMRSSAPRAKSKTSELENTTHVSKVLVKFQGLGYDDVVWDSPPAEGLGEAYSAFREAYHEYVEGKYFQADSYPKIRERIKKFKSADLEEVDVQPAGLKRGKLMGYQLEGLNWLLGNYHGDRSVVLADEMGLGKTVQVVSLVTYLVQEAPKCWPFLIVVPNATCPNWRREFKQWAPDLRVVTYHGGKESQELAYKYELFPNGSNDMKAHVVIMSYDSAQDPKTRVLFKAVHWTGLVVDEGQRLKNDQNLLYLALRAMKIPFRLLLTGTPLQNNKRELFNLLQFIDTTQDAAILDQEYAVLDKDTLPKLHEKIRPYFLRRTKAGVLKFLPPMAQIILPVTMTVIQEKLSKSILAKNPQLIRAVFANDKLKSKDRGSLNNILMQLRKCLCHPFMYSEAIEERHHDPSVLHRNLVEASAKLLLLEIMLPKLKERGHRVLIFSQFLQQLDILEDFLAGMGFQFRRLDGAMSSLEKQRRIDAFNAPDSPLFAFLLSTRAGGVGINLATADTVIIMDPDFNPHQDIQALSRAHRIGQKQKVLCFQLMTKDTVEERIMQVGRKKMALDHALIESMDDDDLAGDDLESILKHGAQALFDENYETTAIHYDDASVDKLLDRSQMEQTKADEEGSAETQFTYARVWANEKQGFDDGLDTAEDEAPVPINSSVWDKILAQREEEARLEAEANKELLGRGGRRRNAINYKTNASLDGIMLPEGVEPESSDSSDEFAGAESADESEDEDLAAKDGGFEDALEAIKPANAGGTDAGNATKSKHAKASQAKDAGDPNGKKPTGAKAGRPQPAPTRPPEAPAASGDTHQNGTRTKSVKARFRNGAGKGQGGAPALPPVPGQSTQPWDYHDPVPRDHDIPSHYRHRTGGWIQRQPYQGMLSGGAQGALPPAMPVPTPGPFVDGVPHMYLNRSLSEAELRLAIDELRHSPADPTDKQQIISTLYHQLRVLRMQNGPRTRIPPNSQPRQRRDSHRSTMDKAKAVFEAFPLPPSADKLTEEYDTAVKNYVSSLSRLPKQARAAVNDVPDEFLEGLDPELNSIGCFFVFDILLAESKFGVDQRSPLLDKLLAFLMSFNPIQARYIIGPFLALLERLVRGEVFSPHIAIDLATTALLRIDPDGSTFTPIHHILAVTALATNCVEPALGLLDADILFYPGMANSKDTRPLCDPDVPSSAFMPSATLRSGPITNSKVLEYELVCGMAHMERRDWAKARQALERVITHPSKDRGVSAMMVAAHKKWLLVGLMHEGKVPTLPSYTSQAAQSAYQLLNKRYSTFAALFEANKPAELKEEFDANQEAWTEDANAELVAEVLAAYQKWQIINLRRVYRRVCIGEVRSTTVDARTGQPLVDDQATLALARDVIQSGMVQGSIEEGPTAAESYLVFTDASDGMSEKVFAHEVTRSQQSIRHLTNLYQASNKRLSSNKDYLRHVVREQKRAEMDREGDAAVELEQIEDEDLMTGVMAHV